MLKRILGIICLFTILAVPAFAVHGGDVIIGQQLVLRIRYPAGGMTIQQRADAVTVRINNLLGSRPFDPSQVTVGVRNKEYVVLIGNTVIITADADTARFNSTTPEQLANIWAANLRRVIPKAKAEPGR
ncbi:MAG: hypothetical protein ACYC27_06055 [Armatimonadota bacterium]